MPLLTDESGAVHWIEDADLQTFLSTASATSAADAADGSVPLPAANNAAAPTDDVNTVFTLGAVPSSQLFVSTLGPVVSEPRQQFGPEVESAVDIWQPQSSAASASTAAQHEYESTPAPSTSNGRGCAYSSPTPAGTAGISSALDSTIFGGSASERALQSLIRVGSDNTGSAQSMIRVGSDKTGSAQSLMRAWSDNTGSARRNTIAIWLRDVDLRCAGQFGLLLAILGTLLFSMSVADTIRNIGDAAIDDGDD